MTLRSALVGLVVSGLLAYLLFQYTVPVPESIQQRDEVFKIFFGRTFMRALSYVGEWLGYDHRLNIYRQLFTYSLFSTQEIIDYDHINVENSNFDGIPVRLYLPHNRADNSPALVWFHGGGWVLGSPESDEHLLVILAKKLNIVIVAVRYRLAPEHVYPAALDDCYKATVHFLNNADQLKVDKHRIAVAGSSAGGNLAAAVTLKARNDALPVRPSLQVLFVPCLQAVDFRTPSYQQNTNNPFLPTERMISFWLWYALGPKAHFNLNAYLDNGHVTPQAWSSHLSKLVNHDLVSPKSFPANFQSNRPEFSNATLWEEIKPIFLDPYFAPLMERNLTGLPEALVITAEWDILRDDGGIYARRLDQEGGVEVEHFHYIRGFHSLYSQPEKFELSRRVIKDLTDYLAKRL